MNKFEARHKPNGIGSFVVAAGVVSLAMALALSLTGGVSHAAPLGATAPSLGQAAAFSALGKTGVTNTGNSVLSGSIGADLDAAMTGFVDSTPAGAGTYGGSRVSAPSVNQAEADALAADLALTAQAVGATPINPALTGQNLVPGAYSTGAALLTGVLTLDGPGAYVFLISSDLTVSGSINFINGARPCDVFWHVTSLASFTGGAFAGTIIAGAGVTFGNGTSLNGRALALTGNVTLINNSISGPSCQAGLPAESATPSQSPTASQTLLPGQATFTPQPTNTPLPTATALPTFPSYVDVEVPCAVNGQGAVRVGLSAGVIVYGLGADITSATDTGANKIIRLLPIGHYDWHAVPPANHYMQTASSGSIDIVACGTPAPGATSVPGATAAPTAISILAPVTGADLAGERALASRQWVRVGLGVLGLGLVFAGYTLRRKQTKLK